MPHWFDLAVFVILAQALGIGLAVSADALSWKWRRDEAKVFAFNCLSLVLLIPLGLGPFSQVFSSALAAKTIVVLLL